MRKHTRLRGMAVLLVGILGGGVYAQAPAAGEFGSFDALQRFYTQKQQDARLAIEKERLTALKAYLPKAKPEELETVHLSIMQSTIVLEQFDQLVALTDSFLAGFSKSSMIWDVRGMRTNALLKLGRLDQARKEWETATANFEKDESQRDFVQPVFETAMEIADGYLDKLDTRGAGEIYDLLSKKLAFLGAQLKPILDPQREALAWIGKEPPALEGKSLESKSMNWADYRGKVVILQFWATWCGPCMALMPELQGVYREFHGQGFEIIGINLDSDMANVKSFLSKQALPWSQIFDADANGANARKFGVTAIPRVFIVNREGKIVRAAMPGEGYSQFIRRLMTRPAPAKS